MVNERTCFLTITNAQPPFDIYSVTITNAAKPSSLTSATATLTFVLDTDADGLPDEWEAAFFGTSTNADPTADSDGDGMLNWEKYIAGTDLTNTLSYLKVDWITEGEEAIVAFKTISNKTYSVLYSDGIDLGGWSKLVDIVAQPLNHLEIVSDPAKSRARFYRLITPQRR